jgi:hypothetical protein
MMLVGQLLYVVVTLFHADGPANDHAAVFVEYAASQTWTFVHLAQFACLAVMLGGLFALFFALDVHDRIVRWAGRLGAALTTVALALYGAVLAVDGVALKQAVNAWVNAPESEKSARFATAEAIRWLEWGTRSYANFTLGVAVLLLASALWRTSWIPRPIAYLVGLSAITYLVQGWVSGSEGFSQTHTIAIVVAEVFTAASMAWLVLIAGRRPDLRSSTGC